MFRNVFCAGLFCSGLKSGYFLRRKFVPEVELDAGFTGWF